MFVYTTQLGNVQRSRRHACLHVTAAHGRTCLLPELIDPITLLVLHKLQEMGQTEAVFSHSHLRCITVKLFLIISGNHLRASRSNSNTLTKAQLVLMNPQNNVKEAKKTA